MYNFYKKLILILGRPIRQRKKTTFNLIICYSILFSANLWAMDLFRLYGGGSGTPIYNFYGPSFQSLCDEFTAIIFQVKSSPTCTGFEAPSTLTPGRNGSDVYCSVGMTNNGGPRTWTNDSCGGGGGDMYYPVTNQTLAFKVSEKNAGVCLNTASAGATPATCQPINFGVGNKFYVETDFTDSRDFPLTFRRYYNSIATTTPAGIKSWRYSYQRSLNLKYNDATQMIAVRDDGKQFYFIKQSGNAWSAREIDVFDRLTSITNGYQYITADGLTEIYDINGRLLSITNRNGLTQTLTYTSTGYTVTGTDTTITVTNSFGNNINITVDTAGLVKKLVDVNGKVYNYNYSGSYLTLTKMTFPDGKFKQYIYDTTFPYNITQIIDENGNIQSQVTYDASGRPITSSKANGVDISTVSYEAIGSDPISLVTNALGKQSRYYMKMINNVPHVMRIENLASTNSPASNSHYWYDANGFVDLQIDSQGNVTDYDYDVNGLETKRIEGLKLVGAVPTVVLTARPAITTTSATRTINTTWNVALRLPLTVTYPDKVVTNTYDAMGKLLTTTDHALP